MTYGEKIAASSTASTATAAKIGEEEDTPGSTGGTANSKEVPAGLRYQNHGFFIRKHQYKSN